MPCKYCLRDYEHDPRCPLYKDKKSYHYCSICGEGILEGEEYIENDGSEQKRNFSDIRSGRSAEI